MSVRRFFPPFRINEATWGSPGPAGAAPMELRTTAEVYYVNGHGVGAAGPKYKPFSREASGEYEAWLWRESGGRWLGRWSTIAEAHAAVEAAVVALLGIWYACERCGAPENPHQWSDGEAIRDRRRCRSCAFWEDRLSDMGAGKAFVTGGRLYSFGDREPTPADLKRCADAFGFGGAPWLIRFRDGRPPRRTRNLWHRGLVPTRFREEFPDDADMEEDHDER